MSTNALLAGSAAPQGTTTNGAESSSRSQAKDSVLYPQVVAQHEPFPSSTSSFSIHHSTMSSTSSTGLLGLSDHANSRKYTPQSWAPAATDYNYSKSYQGRIAPKNAAGGSFSSSNYSSWLPQKAASQTTRPTFPRRNSHNGLAPSSIREGGRQSRARSSMLYSAYGGNDSASDLTSLYTIDQGSPDGRGTPSSRHHYFNRHANNSSEEDSSYFGTAGSDFLLKRRRGHVTATLIWIDLVCQGLWTVVAGLSIEAGGWMWIWSNLSFALTVLTGVRVLVLGFTAYFSHSNFNALVVLFCGVSTLFMVYGINSAIQHRIAMTLYLAGQYATSIVVTQLYWVSYSIHTPLSAALEWEYDPLLHDSITFSRESRMYGGGINGTGLARSNSLRRGQSYGTMNLTIDPVAEQEEEGSEMGPDEFLKVDVGTRNQRWNTAAATGGGTSKGDSTVTTGEHDEDSESSDEDQEMAVLLAYQDARRQQIFAFSPAASSSALPSRSVLASSKDSDLAIANRSRGGGPYDPIALSSYDRRMEAAEARTGSAAAARVLTLGHMSRRRSRAAANADPQSIGHRTWTGGRSIIFSGILVESSDEDDDLDDECDGGDENRRRKQMAKFGFTGSVSSSSMDAMAETSEILKDNLSDSENDDDRDKLGEWDPQSEDEERHKVAHGELPMADAGDVSIKVEVDVDVTTNDGGTQVEADTGEGQSDTVVDVHGYTRISTMMESEAVNVEGEIPDDIKGDQDEVNAVVGGDILALSTQDDAIHDATEKDVLLSHEQGQESYVALQADDGLIFSTTQNEEYIDSEDQLHVEVVPAISSDSAVLNSECFQEGSIAPLAIAATDVQVSSHETLIGSNSGSRLGYGTIYEILPVAESYEAVTYDGDGHDDDMRTHVHGHGSVHLEANVDIVLEESIQEEVDAIEGMVVTTGASEPSESVTRIEAHADEISQASVEQQTMVDVNFDVQIEEETETTTSADISPRTAETPVLAQEDLNVNVDIDMTVDEGGDSNKVLTHGCEQDVHVLNDTTAAKDALSLVMDPPHEDDETPRKNRIKVRVYETRETAMVICDDPNCPEPSHHLDHDVEIDPSLIIGNVTSGRIVQLDVQEFQRASVERDGQEIEVDIDIDLKKELGLEGIPFLVSDNDDDGKDGSSTRRSKSDVEDAEDGAKRGGHKRMRLKERVETTMIEEETGSEPTTLDPTTIKVDINVGIDDGKEKGKLVVINVEEHEKPPGSHGSTVVRVNERVETITVEEECLDGDEHDKVSVILPGDIPIKDGESVTIIRRPSRKLPPTSGEPVVHGPGRWMVTTDTTTLVRPPVRPPIPPALVMPRPVMQQPIVPGGFVRPRPMVAAPRPTMVPPRPMVASPRPMVVPPRPMVVSPRPMVMAPRPFIAGRGPMMVRPRPILVRPPQRVIAPRPQAIVRPMLRPVPRPAPRAAPMPVVARPQLRPVYRPVPVVRPPPPRPVVALRPTTAVRPVPVLTAPPPRPMVAAPRRVVAPPAPVIAAPPPMVVMPQPAMVVPQPVMAMPGPAIMSAPSMITAGPRGGVMARTNAAMISNNSAITTQAAVGLGSASIGAWDGDGDQTECHGHYHTTAGVNGNARSEGYTDVPIPKDGGGEGDGYIRSTDVDADLELYVNLNRHIPTSDQQQESEPYHQIQEQGTTHQDHEMMEEEEVEHLIQDLQRSTVAPPQLRELSIETYYDTTKSQLHARERQPIPILGFQQDPTLAANNRATARSPPPVLSFPKPPSNPPPVKLLASRGAAVAALKLEQSQHVDHHQPHHPLHESQNETAGQYLPPGIEPREESQRRHTSFQLPPQVIEPRDSPPLSPPAPKNQADDASNNGKRPHSLARSLISQSALESGMVGTGASAADHPQGTTAASLLMPEVKLRPPRTKDRKVKRPKSAMPMSRHHLHPSLLREGVMATWNNEFEAALTIFEDYKEVYPRWSLAAAEVLVVQQLFSGQLSEPDDQLCEALQLSEKVATRVLDKKQEFESNYMDYRSFCTADITLATTNESTLRQNYKWDCEMAFYHTLLYRGILQITSASDTKGTFSDIKGGLQLRRAWKGYQRIKQEMAQAKERWQKHKGAFGQHDPLTTKAPEPHDQNVNHSAQHPARTSTESATIATGNGKGAVARSQSSKAKKPPLPPNIVKRVNTMSTSQPPERGSSATSSTTTTTGSRWSVFGKRSSWNVLAGNQAAHQQDGHNENEPPETTPQTPAKFKAGMASTLREQAKAAVDQRNAVEVLEDVEDMMTYGIGLFYFIMSIVPKSFHPVLKTIGLQPDHAQGIHNLERVFERRNTQAPFAALFLLINYLFLPRGMADPSITLDRAGIILHRYLKSCPNGSCFLLMACHHARKMGNMIPTALNHITRGIQTCEASGIPSINYRFEMGLTFFIHQEFAKAADIFEILWRRYLTSQENQALITTGSSSIAVALDGQQDNGKVPPLSVDRHMSGGSSIAPEEEYEEDEFELAPFCGLCLIACKVVMRLGQVDYFEFGGRGGQSTAAQSNSGIKEHRRRHSNQSKLTPLSMATSGGYEFDLMTAAQEVLGMMMEPEVAASTIKTNVSTIHGTNSMSLPPNPGKGGKLNKFNKFAWIQCRKALERGKLSPFLPLVILYLRRDVAYMKRPLMRKFQSLLESAWKSVPQPPDADSQAIYLLLNGVIHRELLPDDPTIAYTSFTDCLLLDSLIENETWVIPFCHYELGELLFKRLKLVQEAKEQFTWILKGPGKGARSSSIYASTSGAANPRLSVLGVASSGSLPDGLNHLGGGDPPTTGHVSQPSVASLASNPRFSQLFSNALPSSPTQQSFPTPQSLYLARYKKFEFSQSLRQRCVVSIEQLDKVVV